MDMAVAPPRDTGASRHGRRRRKKMRYVLLALAGTWTAVYAITRKVLFPQQTSGFANRFVSVVHAVLALSLAFLVVDWKQPLRNIAQTNTKEQTQVMVVSFSYFLYDTVCCFCLEPSDLSNAMHHLATLAGFAVGVFTEKCATELVAALLLAEASSPFLHMRYLLREAGWKGTRMAALNDLAFATSFFVCRIVLGPFLVYYTLRSESHVLCKAGATGLFLVSLFWFRKIVQIAMGKVGNSKKKVAKET